VEEGKSLRARKSGEKKEGMGMSVPETGGNLVNLIRATIKKKKKGRGWPIPPAGEKKKKKKRESCLPRLSATDSPVAYQKKEEGPPACRLSGGEGRKGRNSSAPNGIMRRGPANSENGGRKRGVR